MLKIISEIGVNHDGDKSILLDLIDGSVSAGADFVKLQLFDPQQLVSPNTALASYQSFSTTHSSQQSLLQNLCIDLSFVEAAIQRCNSLHSQLLVTPFDISSAQTLFDLGFTSVKISSGDTRNYPFLYEVGRKFPFIILSVGMTSTSQITESIIFLEMGRRQLPLTKASYLFLKTNYQQIDLSYLTILHCTSSYPTPIASANLLRIPHLMATFSCNVGYSDHTDSLFTGALAVSLGATCLEKHITYDRLASGPDHKASLDISQMHTFVQNSREAALACSPLQEHPLPIETDTLNVTSRFFYAAVDIQPGTVITSSMLLSLRDSNPHAQAIPSSLPFSLIGKVSKSLIHQHDPLTLTMIE